MLDLRGQGGEPPGRLREGAGRSRWCPAETEYPGCKDDQIWVLGRYFIICIFLFNKPDIYIYIFFFFFNKKGKREACKGMRPRTVREGRRELSQEDTTDKTEEGVLVLQEDHW